MKIGVFLRNYNMNEGGAALLIKALKRDLKDLDSDKYEFVTIYNGSVSDPYKKKNESGEFINLTRARLKYIIPAKLYDLKNVPRRILFNILCRKGNGVSSSVWDMMCKKEGIDFLWFTHPVQERTSVPYIFTVWDLGHRILPAFPEMSSGISDWNERENVYREMLYRATRVLTANETGKEEILENYSIPADKIRIVPFPMSTICDIEEAKPNTELPDEYFIYPAHFWPHKNHIRIIEALKILRDEHGIKINVVFTGARTPTRKYIENEIEKLDLKEQVTFAGLVSDAELKYLYLKSRGVIYSSLFGPNNIPPDEAIVLKKPLIISGIKGHREQMGDSALYFDPYNAKELADCILTLLNDEKKMEEIGKNAGKLRDKLINYSYTKTVFPILDELYEMWRCWPHSDFGSKK